MNPQGEVIEFEADNMGWRMEITMSSGPSNNDTSKNGYLVKWDEYLPEKTTWETFDNVNENAKELLKEYYVENTNMEKDK